MVHNNSNIFVPYVNIYFKFYLGGGLTFQVILLILIITKSSVNLRNLQVFLLNTCILQIALISLAFFTQHRTLPNSRSLAILPHGPCQLFESHVCFSAYHFFLGISLCVGLGISNTILFRYRVLKSGRSSRSNAIVMICFTYIPSIITIILPFTSEWNFKEVSAFTYLEHPTYNLTIYEPIIGFYNIYSFQFIAATFLLIFGAYAVPTISGLLTHRVINLINANQSMSPKTKEQSKTLAYVGGLGCQTFLPVVCYIPLPTLYIISQMFKVEVLLTEHLLTILICFPSLLDPLISFYFIVPYRLAICNMVPTRRKKVPNAISVRQVSKTKQIPSII